MQSELRKWELEYLTALSGVGWYNEVMMCCLDVLEWVWWTATRSSDVPDRTVQLRRPSHWRQRPTSPCLAAVNLLHSTDCRWWLLHVCLCVCLSVCLSVCLYVCVSFMSKWRIAIMGFASSIWGRYASTYHRLSCLGLSVSQCGLNWRQVKTDRKFRNWCLACQWLLADWVTWWFVPADRARVIWLIQHNGNIYVMLQNNQYSQLCVCGYLYLCSEHLWSHLPIASHCAYCILCVSK